MHAHLAGMSKDLSRVVSGFSIVLREALTLEVRRIGAQERFT
jgi:hypothetical protein